MPQVCDLRRTRPCEAVSRLTRASHRSQVRVRSRFLAGFSESDKVELIRHRAESHVCCWWRSPVEMPTSVRDRARGLGGAKRGHGPRGARPAAILAARSGIGTRVRDRQHTCDLERYRIMVGV
jgi:hypothetical protein